MPGWESEVFGHTIVWSVFLPAQVLPAVFVLVFLGWPFFEARMTKGQREHHLLQRPRNAPVRTAFLAASVAFYGVLWAAGSNDIIATQLHLSLNQITYAGRAGVVVLPVLAFVVARRWCLSLQRSDEQRLAHGYETGVIMRTPEGGYVERHEPLSPARAHAIASAERSGQSARKAAATGANSS